MNILQSIASLFLGKDYVRCLALKDLYENDPSRGFANLEPWGEIELAHAACYLQGALRKLGSNATTLKIGLPTEAKLPRGWTSISGQYVLIDQSGNLYGTLAIQNLKYLRVELGDRVVVKRVRREGEYALSVFSKKFTVEMANQEH